MTITHAEQEIIEAMRLLIKNQFYWGHGEQKINLIAYNGELVGFDPIGLPKIKFRVSKSK